MPGRSGNRRFETSLPVRWVRLGDIAQKGVDTYMCCRCGEFEQFEDMWTVIPFSETGKQMMQGYIHCGRCRVTDPIQAWQQAHDAEYGGHH